MRSRHKRWAEPYLEQHPEIVIHNLVDHAAFLAGHPLFLEIGAGKGDFVLAMAQKGGRWIALERETSIAGLLAKKVVESTLGNIRVLPADFDVVAEGFQAYRFEGIFLNFSDPWPKRRHEKRRLTFPAKLLEYMRILKSGGYLFFKSDNDGLYEYSRQTFAESPLEVISETNNYETLEVGDALSEYERQFRSEGKNINRIVARRK